MLTTAHRAFRSALPNPGHPADGLTGSGRVSELQIDSSRIWLRHVVDHPFGYLDTAPLGRNEDAQHPGAWWHRPDVVRPGCRGVGFLE